MSDETSSCTLLQGAVSALDVLKRKCNSMLKDAAVLSDKLAAERTYTRSLEQQAHDVDVSVCAWQARCRQALKQYSQVHAKHQATLELLDQVHRKAEKAQRDAHCTQAEAERVHKQVAELTAQKARMEVETKAVLSRAESAEQLLAASQSRLHVHYLTRFA